jgi:hypothetical protein
MIEHRGDSILRLGGARNIQWWRSVQADLVQPQRVPDGLIEARLRGRAEPVRFVVEISTYPYRRLNRQAVDDAVLAHLKWQELPEVLTVVLHPGRRKPVVGVADLASPQGWTRLHLEWRVVEMWKIPAAQLLAANDIGLVPWVTLAKIDVPSEPIFKECRARIYRDASRDEHDNLLAVSQFLARLNYNDPRLFQVLGGRKAMIESPMLKELMAENTRKTMQTAILNFLVGRFGSEARALRPALKAIKDDQLLSSLSSQAGKCPDLESFKKLLEP